MSNGEHDKRISKLEIEHEHFKENVVEFKETYKEDIQDNKKAHGRIETIAKDNSKKIDKLQSSVDKAEGGFKVLGRLIDASAVLTLVVATYMGFVHWIKDLFHR